MNTTDQAEGPETVRRGSFISLTSCNRSQVNSCRAPSVKKGNKKFQKPLNNVWPGHHSVAMTITDVRARYDFFPDLWWIYDIFYSFYS